MKMTEMIGIEIKTTGRSTIPKILPENIITIHGKNGVGKSMASTLMEIAAGEYTFKNEGEFSKYSQIIKDCTIQFLTEKSETYKVHLQPYLWKYDKNFNRVNPMTLGKFYENGSEISYQKFRKVIYVRTIRGNESLHQQITFFQDIFKSKIEEKLQKLEKKMEFLENFENWFKNTSRQADLENYLKLQQTYNELLDNHDDLLNSIKRRTSKIKFHENQLEMLKKLKFILQNNPEDIEKQLILKKEQSKTIQEQINKNYLNLQEIQTKIKDFDKNLNKDEKIILTKLQKLQSKQENIIEILKTQYNISLDSITQTQNEISNNIKDLQEEIMEIKRKIEQLNNENNRILKINSYITRLRDICSQACSNKWKDEKILSFIHTSYPKTEIKLSFSDLYNTLNSSSLIFKEKPALKDYQDKVKKLNNSIRYKKDILEKLSNYAEISEKISSIEKKQKGFHRSIDEFLDLEESYKKFQTKEKQIEELIKNQKEEQLDIISKLQNLEEIKQKIDESPTEIAIKSDLRKMEIKSEISTVDECEIILNKIEKEHNKEYEKLILHKKKLENVKEKIESIKKEIEILNKEVEKSARQFKFKNCGDFLTFVSKIKDKFSNYKKNTQKLYKKLKDLQEDISRIIKGTKPKNLKNKELITSQFDQIFRNIYSKKEFFDYVFKEYRKIKRFDITEKTIIFETKEEFEEKRDLNDFSSGEKTYAYCRAIISIASNVAKYNVVILDESYALLDHEHSMDLYKFQREKIEDGDIAKFINILPIKEDIAAIHSAFNNSIRSEEKIGNSERLAFLQKKFLDVSDFYKQVKELGYYQEIHFPYEKTLTLALNATNLISRERKDLSVSKIAPKLDYSFILDGSNIARNNTNSKFARISDVIKCKNRLIELGIPEEKILILFGAGIRHNIAEIEVGTFNTLLKQSNVNQAPKGQDDDWFIISFAKRNNGYIITNDYYNEYRKKYPNLKEFIENHSIRYNILQDQVYFEQDFEEKLWNILNNKSSN
ncbi:MAG: hypothetical protein DRO88_06625 [Promethearchaeia archaeon]|nr:MAG: hypothetical protein DRO88_06625 [Candidatus Lokiarchaeia archaeon]